MIPPPRRALVLAAGLGTRLRPLTDAVPKPLLPLWNRPLLDRVLEQLAAWGVRDALVNLHHRADAVVEHLRRSPHPLRISLSFEPTICGTGGALRHAAWFLDDAPLWVVNADICLDVEPRPFRRALDRGALAALWLHPRRGPRTVDVRAGTITAFRSARPGAAGTATFCGLQLVRPALLRYLPDTPSPSIVEGYERAMADGQRVAAVETPHARWHDLGTPASYLAAHAEWRPRGAAGPRARWSCRARDATIAPGARVRRSVLLSGACVAAGARVDDAVIGPGCTVDTAMTEMGVRGDTPRDAQLREVFRRLRWDPAQATVLPLDQRGSGRSFTRLRHAGAGAILVRFDAARAENALYGRHARFLHRLGLRVPRVLLDAPAAGLLVLEDLGATSFLDALPTLAPAERERLYRLLLRDVARLHRRGAEAARSRNLPLSPAFGPAVYAYEHGLFLDHIARGRLGLGTVAVRGLRRELQRAAARLRREPAVLVHRDLQSSNVLLRGGKPWLIDFQGMRLGPAAYDLASLLFDPYVSLPTPLRERLFLAYGEFGGAPVDPECLRWAAVERLTQAMGAFARLSAAGLSTFEWHLEPARRILHAVLGELQHVDGLGDCLCAPLALRAEGEAVP